MSLSMLSFEKLEGLLAVPLTATPDTSLAEVISSMNASGQTGRMPDKGDRSPPEIQPVDRLFWEAAKNLERSSCVLIVEGDRLVGTFADADVVGLAARELDLEKTTVGEVMTRDLITIDKSQLEDIFIVLNLFRQQGISHLPVVDELDRIIGLVTPAFIHRVLQPANFLQLRIVAEAMERQTLLVSPAASVRSVVRLMAERQVCCAKIAPETNEATGVAAIPVATFTERDILRCLSLGLDFAELAVGEVAIARATVTPQASLGEANQLLLQNRYPCLTVTADEGDIVGTIAPRNILKAINPISMYHTIRLLQGKVSELQTEKLHVLQTQKVALQSQVQKRTRKLQQQARCDRLLLEISAHIRQSLDLEEILETTVSQVRQFLQCDRVIIYRFDPDWSGEVVAEDIKEGIKPLIGKNIHDPCFAPTWVVPYQNGRLRVVNDIYSLGRFSSEAKNDTSEIVPCHIELLESLQIRAKILVPILLTTEAEDGSSSNHLWGLMSAIQTVAPREWHSVEVQLLKKLATQVAIAIQQSNLYQQSQSEALVRQRSENTLTQERNLLSAILNVAGALIVVLNREGRIIRFNKACEQITGYKFDEVVGRRVRDFLLPKEEAESFKAIVRQLQVGQFPNQHENYWVTKSGSRRLIDWSNTALTDAAGNVEYIVATGIDISDRRRAETALERSETAYATLADSAPVGIFREDIQGNCTYANELACKIVGLLPHQFLGRGWTKRLHPEDSDRVFAEIDLAMENNTLFRSEYRFLHPDGRIVWVVGQSIPQLGDRGKIAGSVGTIMDITKRKQAELELQELNAELEKRVEERTAQLKQSNKVLLEEVLQRRRVEAALVESQERLSDLFENLNDLVQSVSLETGKFLYVNLAWCETLGYEENEIDNLSVFDLIAPENRQGYRDILSQLKAGKLKQIERLEIPFLTKDGRQIILEANINCRYQDGKATATRGIFRDITARKQAENRLNDVLEEFSYHKQALDRFALIAMTDRRGILTYVNNKLSEVSQYKPEELIGKTYRILNSCDRSSSFFEQIWSTITKGKIWRGEIKNKRKNGSFYWVDTVLVPFLDEKGKPEQYLAIFIDITERKEAEEKLKQQLAAMEASGDGISILKEDKYTYLNQAHANIFGYENAVELIGKTWGEVYSSSEISRLERDVFPLLAKQKYWRGQAIGTRKDGTNFVQEISLTLTEDQTLICVCQDITERLKIEEKTRRREALFRGIFEQAAVGIARVDLHGGFLQVNQRMCQMLGYSEEGILTKTLKEITHPQELEADKEYLQQILRGEIETFSREKRYLHKNGSILWGKITVSVVRNSSEELDYFIAVVQDISDRKKAEEEIRNALTREKELNELKSRFITMTSHEFRTPLSVISSSAGIMKTFGPKLSEEKRLTHLQTIENYVQHTTRLLDDILLLNRGEVGNISFDPKPTNIVNFCENLTEEMQTSTASHVITFSNHCPPDTEAEVDIKLLQKITINLLSNAIKYSPDGGEVKFDLSMTDDKLIFQVQDKGIGIPPEDQKHLFESFHRGTNVGTIQGTGLGLVLIEKCVELHKGEVSFTSEVRGGTTFTVTIPLVVTGNE